MKPKRDRSHWLESAPEYVAACRDFGPKVHGDRFTVFIGGSLAFEMKDPAAPRWPIEEYMSLSPSGSFHWGELDQGKRRNCGKTVRWLDLPQDVRNAVEREARTIKARDAAEATL